MNIKCFYLKRKSNLFCIKYTRGFHLASFGKTYKIQKPITVSNWSVFTKPKSIQTQIGVQCFYILYRHRY